MLAIYKRELRSFFHGMMGYVLTAFLLAASGIYFLALNLGYGLTDFGYYTLYRTIFMLLLYFPVLAMRSLAEEGMTMVIVTHEIGFAREVASRLIFIDGGTIAEDGSPEVLLTASSNPRLQEFLQHVS